MAATLWFLSALTTLLGSPLGIKKVCRVPACIRMCNAYLISPPFTSFVRLVLQGFCLHRYGSRRNLCFCTQKRRWRKMWFPWLCSVFPLFLLDLGHCSKVPYILHPAPYITLMYLRRYITFDSMLMIKGYSISFHFESRHHGNPSALARMRRSHGRFQIQLTICWFATMLFFYTECKL